MWLSRYIYACYRQLRSMSVLHNSDSLNVPQWQAHCKDSVLLLIFALRPSVLKITIAQALTQCQTGRLSNYSNGKPARELSAEALSPTWILILIWKQLSKSADRKSRDFLNGNQARAQTWTPSDSDSDSDDRRQVKTADTRNSYNPSHTDSIFPDILWGSNGKCQSAWIKLKELIVA